MGAQKNVNVDSNDRIIRIREVIEMTGLSRSSIYL